ncbi:hypothetical protein MHK_010629 [Candidatus Magnetomorum sp. HK-1]|nr:hypothetical protein MHK_010629 [Candidatus Magnetomorum sp. HK-1]
MKTIKNKTFPKAIIKIWQTIEKKVCLKIEGHSMRPYMQKGDRVELWITQTNAHQFKTGDIIAFLQDEMIIVHRFIKKKKVANKWKICQRGDHLRGFRWIDADQVIGIATAIHRSGKRIDLRLPNHILCNRFLGYLGWLWVFCLERFY